MTDNEDPWDKAARLARAAVPCMMLPQVHEQRDPLFTGKLFPIMGSAKIKIIPWAMIEPHRAQALTNHDQSLERLAERGGLDPGEALAVLEGRLYSRLALPVSEHLLEEKVRAFHRDQEGRK